MTIFHCLRWAPLALALAVSPPASVQARTFVLGDSLGVGLAQVGRVKGLAAIGVHIRGSKALAQIERTPPRSIVYISLGTNDAHGSITGLDRSIDDIVRAADRRQLRMVWLGPPCVRKSWDTRARELDSMLRKRLANTSVHYISMRDREMCSGVFHSRDGIHLKTKGYAYMWARAIVDGDDPRAAFAADQGAAADHTSSLPSRLLEQVPLPPQRPQHADH